MSQSAARRVLLVAFHFPPLAGSSGIQRTLRLAQQLPAFGWEPIVLSAHPRAYERTSKDLQGEVPTGIVVRRAFALDTARHLSIKGRYFGGWARPDRWASWRFDAVRQGLALIRELAPQVIWSTYPIATAHGIGAELQRRSGLPWIADFRDPMAQEGYPADRDTWLAYERIENAAMQQARLATFTTPGAAREYAQRYPHAADRIRVLENGYDEKSFPPMGAPAEAQPLNPGAITLLHSGIVYPSERDPTALFAALRLLHARGRIRGGQFKLRLRACEAEGFVRQLAAQHGVEGYVETLPPVPYRDALAEMLRADALLVMQASNCNAQIPAKLYEYLRAGRPILCLSDPAGDTASTLRSTGIDAIAPLDDAESIAALLARFIQRAEPRLGTLPTAESVRAASRQERTRRLAAWLDEIAPQPVGIGAREQVLPGKA